MSMQRALISLLRGERRCKPVIIGRLHFYHFWRHGPLRDMINVPWIKDLRVKQFAMSGYIPQYLTEAQKYLGIDTQRFAAANAFVAPTETFALEVMRWYNAPRPWIQFANYPDRIAVKGKRRNEVVYLDSSSTVFQEDLFVRLISFLDELHALCGITGVIVASTMRERIAALPHRSHIKVLSIRGEYDCLSKYGILVNLTNFSQAAECLPRKLLFYLHCGMIPLIHATFAESVNYCKREGIEPWTYYDAEEAAAFIDQGKNTKPDFDRERFCIQARIGELLLELQRIGGGT